MINNLYKIDSNLIPERFYTPEEKLIYKILLVAITDIAEYKENLKGNFYDAYQWIMNNSSKPFSFEWCLDALDLYGLKEHIRKIATSVKESKNDKKKYFYCTQEAGLIVKNLKTLSQSHID